ncbi:LacI family transcriptional regulator [Actinoalloteichus hoggarensis]|uniref:HTH-type transcriptional regulator GalS n=1 Tax=Actinoalloteichus hoggarensis TaxID=1470176 RepID=A0A221W958_9PSEU|nr:LacI family DNA-binding transcriptional regulator [Actinoalloteichus hoggarensis]ASO21907.1 HTH-type transcriptional regulator GalS [Actinoalloteichus hoggarensis]MBB5924542.1 LacI family transcriptional regulator [Actinoalloteichus hoggarensis]
MAPTLVDVAARAGVSTATVSRVLNGNYPVSPGTKARVLAALHELDYVVNGPARALAAASSDMLGVIVNDVSDPFFGILSSGIQWEAGGAELLAVICNTAGSPEDELKYMQLLLRQRARAIVLTGGGREDPDHAERVAQLIRQCHERGARVVFCGRQAPPDSEAVSILFDNRGGARALTRHLLAMGHRRFAYVSGPEANTTTTARAAGHRDALLAAGLEPEDGAALHGDFSRASGFAAGMELVRRGVDCTAVVAGNDLTALGVMAALREQGVRVPEDVSVAGFDDLPVAMDAAPALSTVRLPLREAAARAGRLAIGADDMPGPDGLVWLSSELIVRESVGPPGRGLASTARL